MALCLVFFRFISSNHSEKVTICPRFSVSFFLFCLSSLLYSAGAMFFSFISNVCNITRNKVGDEEANDTTDNGPVSFNQLYDTCAYGSYEDVKRLLARQGIDLNARRLHDGVTPLMAAASYNNECAASQLVVREDVDLAAQDDFGQNALMIAISNEALEVFEAIMDQLARLPEKEAHAILRQEDADGHNALMLAAKTGRWAATKSLMDTGAFSPNEFSPSGDTCLMLASMANNHQDLAEILGHPDADPNIQHPSNGKTALQIALEHGSFECVVHLLCHPAIFVSLEPCPPVSAFAPIKAKKYQMASFLVSQYLQDRDAAIAVIRDLEPFFYDSLNPNTEE